MENTDRFISLYKSLEDALETRLRADGRSASNPVHQYLGETESEPIREKLDLCRQVRNLITHSADMGGQPPISPSDALVEALKACCNYVSRPPLALKRATPTDRLLRAVESDRVKWLMKRMTEKGFSHVPVMSNDRIAGVFSATTPFSLLQRDISIGEHTRLSEIMPLLDMEAHLTERFIFINPGVTIVEAARLFARTNRRAKRVAALFITSDGTPQATLLGMLTPWDIVGERGGYAAEDQEMPVETSQLTMSP